MNKVNTLSLESNRKIKINFDGGDLSSDTGLLLIKEFVSKLGIDKLFSQSFKTNDSALLRYHDVCDKLLLSIWIPPLIYLLVGEPFILYQIWGFFT